MQFTAQGCKPFTLSQLERIVLSHECRCDETHFRVCFRLRTLHSVTKSNSDPATVVLIGEIDDCMIDRRKAETVMLVVFRDFHRPLLTIGGIFEAVARFESYADSSDGKPSLSIDILKVISEVDLATFQAILSLQESKLLKYENNCSKLVHSKENEILSFHDHILDFVQ